MALSENRDYGQEALDKLYTSTFSIDDGIELCNQFDSLPEKDATDAFLSFMNENKLPGSTALSLINTMGKIRAENFISKLGSADAPKNEEEKMYMIEEEREIFEKRLLEAYIILKSPEDTFDQEVLKRKESITELVEQ